jgi:hypothetical protein
VKESDVDEVRFGSRGLVVAGWVLSGLTIAFLLLDATMKLLAHPLVLAASRGLGWPSDPGTARTLGTILLVSTVIYSTPRTAALGAVLLTGYLGGAVAAHLRIGSPLFSHVLFGVYVGAMAWGGLYLRDARIRALLRPSH